MASVSNPRSMATTLVVLLLVLVAGGGLLLWRQSAPSPSVELVDAPRAVGRRTPVTVVVRAEKGQPATLQVSLAQGEQVMPLHTERFDGVADTARVDLVLDLGATEAREGEAQLLLRATDDWWRPRGPSSEPSLQIPVLVDLTPPDLQVRAGTRYPEPGGSAVAVLQAPGASRADVEVGSRTFRGHPRGDEGHWVVLYALEVGHDPSVTPMAVARDAAGNRRQQELSVVLRAREVSTGQVDLDRSWLLQKLPTLLGVERADIEGDLGAAFRRVSVDQRAEAMARREALAARSGDSALWEGSFRQMPNTSALSRFGVRRTYELDGQELDEKMHQGFDLASVRNAPIPAANRGEVVWSGPLTIYGNTVILDHGLGLLSLYGHCSSLEVEVGQMVEKGATVARTGATGLAVGDHLHFEMIVGGVPVTPLQWWDGSWIRAHVLEPVEAAGLSLRDGG